MTGHFISELLRAKSVFVGTLPDTLRIYPERARQAKLRRTNVIIAVHLYGNLCEKDARQSCPIFGQRLAAHKL